MNTNLMKTCAILFFALMLGNADITLAGESMKLFENDSGKTVEVRIGDDLEITLPGNPTTGYAWEVSSLDSAVLRLEKSEFMSSDKAIGSSGVEVISLHAIAAGKSVVRLVFHRPFERNKPPIKDFSINVLIKK